MVHTCSSGRVVLSPICSASATPGLVKFDRVVLHQSQKPECIIQKPCNSEISSAMSRRGLMAAAVLGISLSLSQRPHAHAATDQRLINAFRKAMEASDNEAADAAWTEAIKLAPNNAPALSNRGTIRLQAGRWAEARDDLERALQLEGSDAPGRAAELNNLGNAEGALGDWESARQHFEAAAADPEMESIAKANMTLALWEMGDDGGAIKSARQLLRRDGAFLDMRCALTAFLHATGSTAEAEGQWEELQNSEDGVGASLYSRSSAIARVRNRWPPRATAALAAFLAVSDTASARDYDGTVHEYRFATLGRNT